MKMAGLGPQGEGEAWGRGEGGLEIGLLGQRPAYDFDSERCSFTYVQGGVFSLLDANGAGQLWGEGGVLHPAERPRLPVSSPLALPWFAD